MGDLDFLMFGEQQFNVDMRINKKGLGGWEVSISQGDQEVTVTLGQLESIASKCVGYAYSGLEGTDSGVKRPRFRLQDGDWIRVSKQENS